MSQCLDHVDRRPRCISTRADEVGRGGLDPDEVHPSFLRTRGQGVLRARSPWGEGPTSAWPSPRAEAGIVGQVESSMAPRARSAFPHGPGRGTSDCSGRARLTRTGFHGRGDPDVRVDAAAHERASRGVVSVTQGSRAFRCRTGQSHRSCGSTFPGRPGQELETTMRGAEPGACRAVTVHEPAAKSGPRHPSRRIGSRSHPSAPKNQLQQMAPAPR